MRSLSLTGPDNGGRLVLQEVSQPRPLGGDLLIQVHAVGVTPTEAGWFPTWHRKSGEKRSSPIPGHEFSGVVVAMGEEAGEFEIGDSVFGMNDWYEEGATADYCVAPSAYVTKKPSQLTHIQAASVPIGALTAWQALFDHAKLLARESVLIHGASGSVGHFAVQFAKRHGANVIATASTHNVEFVKQLGADQVVDYRSSRFEDFVNQVDVVLDTVGGETLQRSFTILAPNGRVVTIVSPEATQNVERVKNAFFIVEPDQKQLANVATLLQNGSLHTYVGAVLPFARATEAYSTPPPSRGPGKIVISLLTE